MKALPSLTFSSAFRKSTPNVPSPLIMCRYLEAKHLPIVLGSNNRVSHANFSQATEDSGSHSVPYSIVRPRHNAYNSFAKSMESFISVIGQLTIASISSINMYGVASELLIPNGTF